jgi:phosphatidylinositol dimannoside acyltransferase
MIRQRFEVLRARLRAEFKALLELVLLPGLAALLPWRLCFLCFRALSRLPFLYRARCEGSLAVAQTLGFVDEPGRWLRRYRLVTLVDHADLYLSRFRSDSWRRRHLRCDGQWPGAGRAFLGCTFHWGAGMWALRDLARSGVRAHALVGAIAAGQFRDQTVVGRYSLARVAEVGRALGVPPVDVDRDLRKILAAIAGNEALLAAVDVPPDQVATSLPVEFLGQQIRVPNGIFRLAARRRLPVVFYLTGLDFSTGERFLVVTDAVVSSDADQLVRLAYETLEGWVRKQPECWHFWFVFDRFRPSC